MSRCFWVGHWGGVWESSLFRPLGGPGVQRQPAEGQLFLLGLSTLWQLAVSPCLNPGWGLLLCPSPPWSPAHASSPHPSLGAPAALPAHSHPQHRWYSSVRGRV